MSLIHISFQFSIKQQLTFRKTQKSKASVSKSYYSKISDENFKSIVCAIQLVLEKWTGKSGKSDASPFKYQIHKWSNTLKKFVGCCLNVFDHFVGLVLKGLMLEVALPKREDLV